MTTQTTPTGTTPTQTGIVVSTAITAGPDFSVLLGSGAPNHAEGIVVCTPPPPAASSSTTPRASSSLTSRSDRMLRRTTHTRAARPTQNKHRPGDDQDIQQGRYRRPAVFLTVALLASAVLAGVATPAQAQQQASTAHYFGLDGNWYKPANWSTGQIPGRDTDVILDGLDDVTIDPSNGPAEVQIGDLIVRDFARLTTLPGTTLRSEGERLAGSAAAIYRATEGYGESLTAERCLSCTMVLNPNPKVKRTIILQSSFVPQSLGGGISVQFGLGGRVPASAGHVGPGHYATLTAESAALGGRLALATYYGFTPTVGERYQIVTAERVEGRFANAAEGDLVARFGDVGLKISYRGGDGNDVVLTAIALR